MCSFLGEVRGDKKVYAIQSYQTLRQQARGSCLVFSYNLSLSSPYFRQCGGKAVKCSFVVENFIGGVALILIIYFYAVVYYEVRQSKVSAVNQASIQLNAKLEFKVTKLTVLLTAALIMSFAQSGIVRLLSLTNPYFRTNYTFRLNETMVQLIESTTSLR